MLSFTGCQSVVLAQHPGNAEVGHLEHPVFAEEHVFRLHVTVQDATLVGAAQSRARHQRNGAGRLLVEPSVDESTPDGPARQSLHDQDAGVIVLDVVVHWNDVRVVDRRQDLCFGQEPGAH